MQGSKFGVVQTFGSYHLHLKFDFQYDLDLYVFPLNGSNQWFNENFLCYMGQQSVASGAIKLDDSGSMVSIDLERCGRLGIYRLDLLMYASEGDDGVEYDLSSLGNGSCTIQATGNSESLTIDLELANNSSFGFWPVSLEYSNGQWKFVTVKDSFEEDVTDYAIKNYGTSFIDDHLEIPTSIQPGSPFYVSPISSNNDGSTPSNPDNINNSQLNQQNEIPSETEDEKNDFGVLSVMVQSLVDTSTGKQVQYCAWNDGFCPSMSVEFAVKRYVGNTLKSVKSDDVEMVGQSAFRLTNVSPTELVLYTSKEQQ